MLMKCMQLMCLGSFHNFLSSQLHYEAGSGANGRIFDVLQKMGSVLSGHFTRGLAAISTPTTLESSASLTGSSSATGGLCQRGQWRRA